MAIFMLAWLTFGMVALLGPIWGPSLWAFVQAPRLKREPQSALMRLVVAALENDPEGWKPSSFGHEIQHSRFGLKIWVANNDYGLKVSTTSGVNELRPNAYWKPRLYRAVLGLQAAKLDACILRSAQTIADNITPIDAARKARP